MTKPRDQAALDYYRAVLLSLGRVRGYIEWKKLPLQWLTINLPDIRVEVVHELMISHIESGGRIHQVLERRPEFVQWRFHYDLRLPISNRLIYIESVLDQGKTIEDGLIVIVNMHDR